MWPLSKNSADDLFWTEILPHLKGFETQTWSEILLRAKKQNHSIDVDYLNKGARDRLDERHIEAEAVYSLRLSGTHRLYGIIDGSVFSLLWFDADHGDNDTCVCRARKKYT